MRCGNRIVADGAQDFQVRARCGDPFFADRYVDVEVLGAYGPIEQQREVQYDIWYYNFGPGRLMRRLILRDGILVREETLGYGVDEIGDDCDPNRNYEGFSIGELVARCGEPASRRREDAAVVHRPVPGYERWREQRREDWIYDFGDARFVRVFRIVDGSVTGVERVPR